MENPDQFAYYGKSKPTTTIDFVTVEQLLKYQRENFLEIIVNEMKNSERHGDLPPLGENFKFAFDFKKG